MTAVFWTEEKIEAARRLLADGYTASMVGRVIGCSRNAVIGKIHRLEKAEGTRIARRIAPSRPNCVRRIKARKPKGEARKPAKQARRPAVSLAAKPSAPFVAAAVPLPTPAAPPKPAAVFVPGKPCGILKVTGCRWPIGEGAVIGRHLFCNAEKHDERYCEFHAREGAAPYSATLIKKTVKSVRKAA